MKIYLKKSITLILALFLCASFLYAEGLEKGKKQVTRGPKDASPQYTWLNINNISTWIYSNGNSDINGDGDSGFIYPKGSGKAVFFESGLIWGGSIAGYWTVGGSAYKHAVTAGRILADGTADESTGARIYRVRPDYKDFEDEDQMADLFSSEIDDEGVTAAEIYAQYDLDWQQWPATWGAPFIDKDGDGVYNPDVDVPGVSEEPSQTIWFVANDLDEGLTVKLYGGLPMTIEFQATFFGFNTTGALGNTIFRKYKVINKNTKQFDSMYLCMWSDPDLGYAFDDFTGCDTTLSMGFVYNGGASDQIYSTTPPASGFDFFQGPKIPGEATDSAKYNGSYVKGYKGLGMTSFFYFSQNVETDFTDPTQNDYSGALQWRNMFEGKKSRTGVYYTDPLTGAVTKYPLAGDPVTGTGWIDGILHVKNDRRFGLVSGPFTMNAGDTQEVVVGQLAGGGDPGVGNLAAVSVLKFYDKTAQAAYDNDFNVATPPVNPSVKVSEMDQEIMLSWADYSSYYKTEAYSKSGFTFQGYKIYQLASDASTIATATLLQTYDIVDDVQTVVSQTVDGGAVVTYVSAYGTNSGIKRYFDITTDKIKGLPLYNGSKYYFAVTAYAYNPDDNAVPNMLESSLNIQTCTPQGPLPGERLATAVGDTIAITHSAGTSEGIVQAIVVDPAQGNGKTYTITLNGEDTYNILLGSTVLFSNMPINGVADDNPIVAGIQVHVAPPAYQGLKAATMTTGSNPWSEDGTGLWFYSSSFDYLWSGGLQIGWAWWYNGSTGNYGSSLTSYSQYHDVVLKFADFDNTSLMTSSTTNASLGYRYMRAANSTAASSTFAAYIKNKVSYGYQEFGLNGAPNIPIAAYDQTTGKRLDVGCFENNAWTSSTYHGLVDGVYYPSLTVALGGQGNGTAREAFFIFSSEYSTTVRSEYSQLDRELLYNTTYGPLPIMYWVNAPLVKAFSSADEMLITSYKIYTTDDTYSFTVPAVTSDAATAKEDVTKVNVYPNPYYGVNSQEINKYQRWVTFTHLPTKATIKIFNISGQLVRTITKNETGQYQRWDLATDSGLPVAGGVYVAYVDMPEQGVTKTVKFSVILEQQYLDRF